MGLALPPFRIEVGCIELPTSLGNQRNHASVSLEVQIFLSPSGEEFLTATPGFLVEQGSTPWQKRRNVQP